MAAELESLVVKVKVDLSPLQAAFTELERLENRVQKLSKQMPTVLVPAVMRGSSPCIAVGDDARSALLGR